MNPAYARLLLMCAAFAAGETAAWALGAYSVAMLVGAALGAAVFIFTQGSDRPRGGRGGDVKYWRGRRLGDDEGPRRWN